MKNQIPVESFIERIKVSDIRDKDRAFNFCNTIYEDLTKEDLSKQLTPINLLNYNLNIGTSTQLGEENLSIKEKLNLLREEIKKNNLHGFLVSTNDEYLNEYTSLFGKRLFYITGFNGSYGFALITLDKAVLFVDGRYTEQAKNQVDQSLWQIESLSFVNIVNHIQQDIINKYDNAKLGIDSRTVSYELGSFFVKSSPANTIEFLNNNLIDYVWLCQPPKPISPVFIYKQEYCGEGSKSKINKLTKILSEKNIDLLLVTALDEIAWLLNLRGNDVENCPLFLSTLALSKDGSINLFMDKQAIQNAEVEQYLQSLNVTINDEDKVSDFLSNISNKQIGLSRESSYFYFKLCSKHNEVTLLPINPVKKLKAIKNTTEIKNTIEAHIKDGLAYTRVLIWLNEIIKQQSLSEMDVVNKIEQIKGLDDSYLGKSFDSIVASNGNAAFPHYHPTESNNSKIDENSLVLIDIGSQYLTGTTDVTRSFSFTNNASNEFKEAFTRVLKGFISLSSLHFPENIGLSGKNLDALARQHLWNGGIHFSHGTGHGVGHYLNVHEGPINFNQSSEEPFKEGMIISIEPGAYKVDKFGIRTENLVVITKSSLYDGYLMFKPLTMIPLDTKNIVTELLTSEEKQWLNNYHKEVRENLTKIAKDQDEVSKIIEMTAPVN